MSTIWPLWSSHTKRKAKATSLHWVLNISSLPATPGESERGRFSIGFYSHRAKSEKNIAFAFAWCGSTIRRETQLQHKCLEYIK